MNLSRRKFLVGIGATAAAAKLAPVAIAAPAETASPWLACNGQAISRTTYAGLFEVIGTIYGADDELTFRLPDMRRYGDCMIRAKPAAAEICLGWIVQRVRAA